jgi:hypothetical protein
MVLAVANDSIQGFSDSSLCWMERNPLKWADNTIPCLSLVYRVEVLSWWKFVQSVPNSSLQSSSAVRVSPQDVAAARMSAACGNVRAVVATSALAKQPLF